MTVKIPEPFAPYLRIGTCSWKYDSWRGLYYRNDRDYKANDFLPDYAEHLTSVEVDQWFWSLFPGGVKLPDPATVTVYAESVPDDFKFTVKAPNALTLTHFYKRQPKAYADFADKLNPYFLSSELLERFLETLEPMGSKLGPIMFQFEYLNLQKMSSLQAFLDHMQAFIESAPKGYQFAVETRNPKYLSDRFFDFLRAHELGFVFLEGYYMPHIGQVFDTFKPSDLALNVIRLHGGDRGEIEKASGGAWDKIIAPKPEGLEAAVRIVCENLKRKTVTYLNVNNHFEGSAPRTITRFLEALDLLY